MGASCSEFEQMGCCVLLVSNYCDIFSIYTCGKGVSFCVSCQSVSATAGNFKKGCSIPWDSASFLFCGGSL